jgi:hypothetical protein
MKRSAVNQIILESIEDGTTLKLYYQLAPNQMLVPRELMEKEFLALAETEGIADIRDIVNDTIPDGQIDSSF